MAIAINVTQVHGTRRHSMALNGTHLVQLAEELTKARRTCQIWERRGRLRGGRMLGDGGGEGSVGGKGEGYARRDSTRDADRTREKAPSVGSFASSTARWRASSARLSLERRAATRDVCSTGTPTTGPATAPPPGTGTLPSAGTAIVAVAAVGLGPRVICGLKRGLPVTGSSCRWRYLMREAINGVIRGHQTYSRSASISISISISIPIPIPISISIETYSRSASISTAFCR